MLVTACFDEPEATDDSASEESAAPASTSGGEAGGSSTTRAGPGNESTDQGTANDAGATAEPCRARFESVDECTDEPEGMVVVEATSFEMGCDQAVEEPACDASEFPVHSVALSTFAIDALEVTVSDFDVCVAAGECTARAAETGCHPPNDAAWADHPANCTTWSQAATYCAWKGKTLPTEAQWERVAEGPENLRWPWGDRPNPTCDLAVIVTGGPGCGTDSTFPVGSLPAGATAEGVLDMTGNVAEWTADYFSETAYAEHDDVDPLGPANGTERVTRGAGYVHGEVGTLRVRSRLPRAPDQSAPWLGFRCALPASGG